MRRLANAEERRHLARVLALGCIVCGAPAVIHHPRSGTASGMGLKAPHKDAIPLCPPHHTDGGPGVAIHAGQETWESIHGTEMELLAQVRAELGIMDGLIADGFKIRDIA